ncbi:hypothetical protein T492DRAFT_500570 [Pavlovales sp. CCMP2436]|nr:hypothetical protein T492DRAFT_500570 [Pavlovales sp. CCMP2436]
MALRLCAVHEACGDASASRDVARAALERVVAWRSARIVEAAARGVELSPSATTDSRLLFYTLSEVHGFGAGAAPSAYSLPDDALAADVACLHVDLLLAAARAELALGLHKGQTLAARAHTETMAGARARRATQAVYGRKSRVDAAREAAEDAALPAEPELALETERRLLSDACTDGAKRALALIAMAYDRLDPEAAEAVLAQAADALRQLGAREAAAARAAPPPWPGGPGAGGAGRPPTSSSPPPPQVVYWTETEVCLRPAPWSPREGAPVASVALYGKPVAAGVAVSANNSELDGLGLRHAVAADTPWKLSGESSLLGSNALHGCVLVRGLVAGTPHVFAAAAYDARGEAVGGIGGTSVEVVTSLPLPRLLLWAYVCRAATQLGARRVAIEALAELCAAFLAPAPPGGAPAPPHMVGVYNARALWAHSPLDALRLVAERARHSPPPLLRALASALLAADGALGAQLPGRSRARKGYATGGIAAELAALHAAKPALLALQLGSALADAPLVVTAATRAATALLPLCTLASPPALLLGPLASCHAALRALPAAALRGQADAPKLFASLTALLLNVALREGEPELARTLAAATDVRAFAAAAAGLVEVSKLNIPRGYYYSHYHRH